MADKYISAKQASAHLRSVLYETAASNVGINDDFASACEEIADNRLKIWLDDIPAADVEEVRHARWEHDKDDELCAGYCSCCGWMAIIMETDVADLPYCPNCGARMDGGKDNV